MATKIQTTFIAENAALVGGFFYRLVRPQYHMSDTSNLLAKRVHCPCCGYPTLESGADYEICELCNWEDDGQSDDDADGVGDGPNADYSLSEARSNFKRYLVMYAPDRDMRITGADSPLEHETKRLLIEAFETLKSSNSDREALERGASPRTGS